MALSEKFSYTELGLLSIQDLVELNKRAVSTIKSKRLLAGLDNATKLTIDATVKINSPKFIGDDFKVFKINKAKAVLTHVKTNVNYTVPFSMIVT